ncbi:MAG TPA: hypothetical protein VGR22_08745 [Thermomicrobiales bacterium]|nr:hypothetical protein [Thermomicrobiales bacterium]
MTASNQSQAPQPNDQDSELLAYPLQDGWLLTVIGLGGEADIWLT